MLLVMGSGVQSSVGLSVKLSIIWRRIVFYGQVAEADGDCLELGGH